MKNYMSYSRIKAVENEDWARVLGVEGIEKKETKAILFGRLFHIFLLEPEKITSREVVGKKIEIIADNEKYSVSEDELVWLDFTQKTLWEWGPFRAWRASGFCERAFAMLSSEGLDHGVEPIEWRSKVDMYSFVEGRLIGFDLKSTSAKSLKDCYKDIAAYGYLMQAWIYSLNLSANLKSEVSGFVFIFVSKENGKIYPIEVDLVAFSEIMAAKLGNINRRVRKVFDNPEPFLTGVYQDFDSVCNGEVSCSMLGLAELPGWYARELEKLL